MTYEKPQIVLINNATLLVRGCKSGLPLDAAGLPRIIADAELDE